MICKNCGKIIPDGTRFCGYCGAKMDNEEKAEIMKDETAAAEETVPEEPVSTEPSEEIISGEMIPEEPAEETTGEVIAVSAEETPAEEPEIEEKAEVIPERELPAEEPATEETVIEEAAEPEQESEEKTESAPEAEIVEETPAEDAKEEAPADPSLEEEQETDQEPAADQDEIMDAEISDEIVSDRPEKPNAVLVFLQNLLTKAREHVHKEDYLPLLESLKHPEAHVPYTAQSVCTVFVVTLILNWIAFHGFMKGACTELIMIFCALVVQFADDSRSFYLPEAVRRTAEIMEIPALLIFAACLFTRSEADHVQYMIFVILAAVRYAIGCGELAERSRHGYLHMIFVAAAFISAGILTGLI